MKWILIVGGWLLVTSVIAVRVGRFLHDGDTMSARWRVEHGMYNGIASWPDPEDTTTLDRLRRIAQAHHDLMQ